jgi:hypothetical protein
MNERRIDQSISTRWVPIGVAIVLFLFYAFLGHPPLKLGPYYFLALITSGVAGFGTAWLLRQIVTPKHDGVFTIIGGGALLLLLGTNCTLTIVYRAFLFAWQNDGVVFGVFLLINAIGVLLVWAFPSFASFAGNLTIEDKSNSIKRRDLVTQLEEIDSLYLRSCKEQNCESLPASPRALDRLRENARVLSPSIATQSCMALDNEIEVSVAKLRTVVRSPLDLDLDGSMSFDCNEWKIEIEKNCDSITELFRRREATLVV